MSPYPWIGPRWPVLAAVASAAMLAAAHAFERFGGLAPCALCLTQREVYWAALGVGAAASLAAIVQPRWGGLAGALALAAVFLVGVYWAAFHAGAEWGFWDAPASCAAAIRGGFAPDDLLAALDTPQRVIRCDEPAWVFLGLSMAGWNALISLGLAGLSGWSAAAIWSKKP